MSHADIATEVLEGERRCLWAMLAAEQRTLDPGVRRSVDRFFAVNVAWLTELVRHGRRDGTIAGVGSLRPATRP